MAFRSDREALKERTNSRIPVRAILHGKVDRNTQSAPCVRRAFPSAKQMQTGRSNPSQQFKHKPLSLSASQIRLIKVKYGSSTGHIDCTLETFPFAASREDAIESWWNTSSNSASMPYRALSYTRGPAKPSERILINGRPFEVRRNLHRFLRVVKNSKQACDYHYWIDQICIDQNDVEERNRIVARMPQIYSSASQVVVWLGSTTKDSTHAMELLSGRTNIERSFEVSRDRQALGALLNREYWHRVWIVQELNLARKISFWCGRHQIDLKTCRQGLSKARDTIFREVSAVTNSILTSPAFRLIKFANARAEPWQWKSLIATFGDQHCSDIRDKIFGLQGLVEPAYRVNVDYHLRSEQLILKLLEKALQQEKRGTVRSWLDLKTPRMFADALFGPGYPWGVLMALQGYLWSQAFVDIIDSVEHYSGEEVRHFLSQARTVKHRLLAEDIWRCFEQRAGLCIESSEAKGPPTLEAKAVNIKKTPTVASHQRDGIGSSLAGDSNVEYGVSESESFIQGGHLQHRDELSYDEILETFLHRRPLHTTLSLWNSDSCDAAESGLRDFSRQIRLDIDSELLFNPSYRHNRFECVLPFWSLPKVTGGSFSNQRSRTLSSNGNPLPGTRFFSFAVEITAMSGFEIRRDNNRALETS